MPRPCYSSYLVSRSRPSPGPDPYNEQYSSVHARIRPLASRRTLVDPIWIMWLVGHTEMKLAQRYLVRYLLSTLFLIIQIETHHNELIVHIGT